MSTQPDSSPDRRSTTVYPADGGASVSYPGCEIDEVDAAGTLRVGVYGPAASEDDTPVYVVWAPGAWQRAETVVAAGGAADPSGDPRA